MSLGLGCTRRREVLFYMYLFVQCPPFLLGSDLCAKKRTSSKTNVLVPVTPLAVEKEHWPKVAERGFGAQLNVERGEGRGSEVGSKLSTEQLPRSTA